MRNSKEQNPTNNVKKYEHQLLSPSNLALLLILSEGPMYGYQINNIIKNRGMRNWVDIEFSTIYKSLDELNRKGFIEGKKEVNGVKTAKKVYSITNNGTYILKRQIKLAIKNPPHPKDIFDLGLAGIYHLSKQEALKVLSEYQEGIEQGLGFFKEIIEKLHKNKIDEIAKNDPEQMIAGEPAISLQKNPMLYIIKALFERPYHRVMGELNWLKRFIQSVKNDETPLK
ncbi:MAG: PadR family transcriptional regulator [Candidatus Helarchaeota archaeon]|nr:PadR family transcriptional regulator [Candidatus Helarchaeota archaeon]